MNLVVVYVNGVAVNCVLFVYLNTGILLNYVLLGVYLLSTVVLVFFLTCVSECEFEQLTGYCG